MNFCNDIKKQLLKQATSEVTSSKADFMDFMAVMDKIPYGT